MEKVKISLVSYLNSKPFHYGIEQCGLPNAELCLDHPSECARKLLNNEVDLGLVPIAVLPLMKQFEIVSDFCIGSDGPVRTVVLVSDVPLEDIDTILLDYQSRTSVMLTRVLAHFFWKKEVQWKAAPQGYETSGIGGRTAGVIIGDRVFNIENRYKYSYDLSEEWQKFTGLPFVFATWTANRNLPEEFLHDFNKCMTYGITNLDSVISDQAINFPHYNLKSYFKDNLCFHFDREKQKALEKFWSLQSQLID